jgi:hypothetical protein
MARLAKVLHERLTPSQGERPGCPTDADWQVRPKVPMSLTTQRKLRRLAKQVSMDGRQVSPMQLAAQLLEDAVARLQEDTDAE